MRSKINTFLLLVIVGLLTIIAFQIGRSSSAQKSDQQKDNQELLKLYKEDQSDRAPEKMGAKNFDPLKMMQRDKIRENRVKELYAQNALKTGVDYYNAAMILQHAEAPEDYLLAHELCVAAIIKGNTEAKWLAAASEDRFLMSIKRPQRFGTQYRSEAPENILRLYQTDAGVTDELRKVFDVPALAEAKAREKEFSKKP